MKSGIPYRTLKPSRIYSLPEWNGIFAIKFSSAIPFSPCHCPCHHAHERVSWLVESSVASLYMYVIRSFLCIHTYGAVVRSSLISDWATQKTTLSMSNGIVMVCFFIPSSFALVHLLCCCCWCIVCFQTDVIVAHPLHIGKLDTRSMDWMEHQQYSVVG